MHVSWSYDQLNRLTQKLYPDTTTVNYTLIHSSRVMFEEYGSRMPRVSDPTGAGVNVAISTKWEHCSNCEKKWLITLCRPLA